MLLTLKPPPHDGISSSNAYSPKSSMPYYNAPSSSVARPEPPPPSATPRSAGPGPGPQSAHPPPPSSSAAPTSATTDQPMDVSHRNLPPMSSVNLPPPERLGSQAGAVAGAGAVSHLPPPPSQWQNADDSMRQWLQAKAEEDRRRQEEERTRQETLKLDQRKIEQAMLRDSLQSGVPPHVVPFIFTGLGGGNQQLPQQYVAQPQQAAQGQTYHQVQPQPHPHPQSQPTQAAAPGAPVPPNPQVAQMRAQQQPADFAGDARNVPANPYAAQTTAQPTPVQQRRPSSPQQQQQQQQQQQGQYRLASTGQPTVTATTATTTTPAVPPAPQAGRLSHINTTEMATYSPSPNTSVPSAASAGSIASQNQNQNQRLSVSTKKELQQQDQNQQQLSPIHFYHWIPPNQSQPNTPAGKSPHTSPHSSNTASYLRSEYQISPKKRKAQGPHQQAPPPPSQLSESTSQSRTRTNSTGRRNTGHARNRSQTLPSSHGESKLATHSANQDDHANGGSSSGRNGDSDSAWPDQTSTVTADGGHEPNKGGPDGAQEWHKEDSNPVRDVDGDRSARSHENEKTTTNGPEASSREAPASAAPNHNHNHSSYDDTGGHQTYNGASDNINAAKPIGRDVVSEDGDRGAHLHTDVSAGNSDRGPPSPSR